MPYKFETDKIPMPKDKDKRCKLTDAQRSEIRELYGTISQRKLAEMYKVSRRLITFIGCPEKREENLKRREEAGGWARYYDKEKFTEYKRVHRKHKKEVLMGGV